MDERDDLGSGCTVLNKMWLTSGLDDQSHARHRVEVVRLALGCADEGIAADALKDWFRGHLSGAPAAPGPFGDIASALTEEDLDRGDRTHTPFLTYETSVRPD